MIKILSDSEPGTLAVSISGTSVHDDSATLESELQLRADRESNFNLVVELSGVDGLEPSAIRDDLMFAKKYSALLGVVSSSVPTPLVPTYARDLGVEAALDDQRAAASLMWVGSMAITRPPLIVSVWHWAAAEERIAERPESASSDHASAEPLNRK